MISKLLSHTGVYAIREIQEIPRVVPAEAPKSDKTKPTMPNENTPAFIKMKKKKGGEHRYYLT